MIIFKWADFKKLTSAQNYLQRHIWMLYEFQQYGEIRQKKRGPKDMSLDYFGDVLSAGDRYSQWLCILTVL